MAKSDEKNKREPDSPLLQNIVYYTRGKKVMKKKVGLHRHPILSYHFKSKARCIFNGICCDEFYRIVTRKYVKRSLGPSYSNT